MQGLSYFILFFRCWK